MSNSGPRASPMICIPVSHCIYADVTPRPLLITRIRRGRATSRWCVFRVHTLGVCKRKRMVACTMVSAYLWVCTVKYKSVYAYIVVQPGLCGRALPVFVNITLPKNILLLIPGRRSLVRHAEGIFSLDIPASICSCTVHILGRFCATSESFFFFSFVKRSFFYCIVLSRWELIVGEKFALFFVFSFLFPLRFCAKLSPVIGDEEGWLHFRIVQKYLFYRRIRYFENNRKRLFRVLDLER